MEAFGFFGCKQFGNVDGISSMCCVSLWDSNDRSVQRVTAGQKREVRKQIQPGLAGWHLRYLSID